jgi:C-terminal processing protease CtpA/Prc
MRRLAPHSSALAGSAALASLLVSGCGAPRPQDASAVRDEFSGGEFFYYDADDRHEIVEDAFKAIGNDYAGLEVKRARIGLDLATLQREALAAEDAAPAAGDDDPVGQARSNLAFLDRLRGAVAAFQDTHFDFEPTVPTPWIDLGLEIAETEGGFRVIALSESLMRYDDLVAGGSAFSAIALGDEVVAIDGDAPAAAVQALASLQSASSPEFARSEATFSLTYRSYAYPERATQSWTFRKADGTTTTLAMPWYVDAPNPRRDAARLLAAVGLGDDHGYAHVQAALAAADRGDPADIDLAPSIGHSRRDPLAGTTDLAGFKRPGSSKKAFTTGRIERDGKRYGVLQIMTYETATVVRPDGATVDFLEPIRAFVNELKASGTPLIIDLRFNGGGKPELALGVMAILARAGDRYATTTQAYRVTRRVRQMLETWTEPDAFDPAAPDGYDARAAAIHFARLAAQDRQPYTAVFADGRTITADPAVGGYPEAVVALVTPDCISTCDMQAMLFQASGRVTLVGTHANGTGLGREANDLFPADPWQDDFGVVKLSIPNALFGVPGPVGRLAFEDAGAVVAMSSENRAVTATEPYAPTLVDYLQRGAGWVSKATAVLDAASPR